MRITNCNELLFENNLPKTANKGLLLERPMNQYKILAQFRRMTDSCLLYLKDANPTVQMMRHLECSERTKCATGCSKSVGTAAPAASLHPGVDPPRAEAPPLVAVGAACSSPRSNETWADAPPPRTATQTAAAEAAEGARTAAAAGAARTAGAGSALGAGEGVGP